VTRKDYVLLAEALKIPKIPPALNERQYALGRIDAALHVADALARDNPRFDRERFLKAAGVQS
jgi:hypothetical protein